jgi:hypothetical protein
MGTTIQGNVTRDPELTYHEQRCSTTRSRG